MKFPGIIVNSLGTGETSKVLSSFKFRSSTEKLIRGKKPSHVFYKTEQEEKAPVKTNLASYVVNRALKSGLSEIFTCQILDVIVDQVLPDDWN